jgi:hypothetical protein
MKAIGDRDVRRGACAALLILASVAAASSQVFKSPPPGSVYREYKMYMPMDLGPPGSGRVTTPEAAQNYPDRVWSPTNEYGDIYLPNRTFVFTGVQTSNAIRAEMVITMWGGHVGTTPKWFTFNGERVDIPELQTTPTNGECYTSQYNVAVDVPLPQLGSDNAIQGDAGGQTSCGGFGWPQWAWYGAILRVYYNPSSVTHPSGQITSPGNSSTFGENPTVTVATSGGVGTDRVDVLAYYDGYDTDGDGVFLEYHNDYHSIETDVGPRIGNHVGTSTTGGPNFQVSWNTGTVPDQNAGVVKFIARIHGSNGVWFVTDEVADLTFHRASGSKKLYKPRGVQEYYWVRNNENPRSSYVDIATLSDMTNAFLVLRTWNGIDGAAEAGQSHYTRVNGWETPEYGQNHYYSYDRIPIDAPGSNLNVGENVVSFYSQSIHHGIEILWPGPAIMVEYGTSVNPPLPAQPALVSPVSGSADQPLEMLLDWNPASDAEAYRLQVATDAGFSTIVFEEYPISNTSKQIGPLAEGTKHYWRVRASNVTGNGPWSDVWNFTTGVAAPDQAVLVSPSNNATGVSLTPTLRWLKLSTASAYTLQVSEDQNFGSTVVDDNALTDTLSQVGPLGEDRTYYWRVAGSNGGGVGAWSTTRQFRTRLNVPQQVTLSAPGDGASVKSPSVMLEWHPAAGVVDKYWVEYSPNSSFTPKTVDSSLVDTTKVLTGLSDGTTYYWRVRGGNVAGWGPYSTARSFSVVLTDIRRLGEVPREFVLDQNYPNPFNPTTDIRYGVPREGYVRLEVYSIVGELVATLVDGVQSPGYYAVRFDAQRFPSGMYLYRLKAEGASVVKKMVLTK